jgi:DNA topoisomerase-3
MPDFVYTEKSLRFHVGDYVFISRIRDVIHEGWRKSEKKYPSLMYMDDDEDDVIEVYNPDVNNCFIHYLYVQKKKTQPKKEFALDTLLACMERRMGEGEAKLACLGTPATRAEIIKKLFAAYYVREDKNKLYATERGKFLLEQLSKSELLKALADVSTTTGWEERLARDPEAFEKEIKEYVALCVKSGTGSATFQRPSLGFCPLCKRPVYETKLGYCCSGYKEEPKCNFVIWKTIAGATLSTNDAQLLLIGQKTRVKKCKSKAGKEFEAAFALKGGEVEFIFKK